MTLKQVTAPWQWKRLNNQASLDTYKGVSGEPIINMVDPENPELRICDGVTAGCNVMYNADLSIVDSGINDPVLVSPAPGSTGVALEPVLTTAAFSSVGDLTHGSTTWRVYNDAMEEIYSSVDDAINLTSIDLAGKVKFDLQSSILVEITFIDTNGIRSKSMTYGFTTTDTLPEPSLITTLNVAGTVADIKMDSEGTKVVVWGASTSVGYYLSLYEKGVDGSWSLTTDLRTILPTLVPDNVRCIAMSNNGQYIAVGRTDSNVNANITILEDNGSGWVVADTIVSTVTDALYDVAVGSLDFTYDGGTLVVGYPYHKANAEGAGGVEFFNKSGGSWVGGGMITIPRGHDRENFGRLVVISDDGTRAAAYVDGVTGSTSSGLSDSGGFRDLKYDGNSWTLGDEIIPTGYGPSSAITISRLSRDGSVLVMGDYHYRDYEGRAIIFDDVNGNLTQRNIATPIVDGLRSYFGRYFDLDPDGDVLVASNRSTDNSANGMVEIIDLGSLNEVRCSIPTEAGPSLIVQAKRGTTFAVVLNRKISFYG